MKKLMILGFAVATVALLSTKQVAFAGKPTDCTCEVVSPGAVAEGACEDLDVFTVDGNLIRGTSGNDIIDCSDRSKRIWIEGEGGNDTITGGDGNDYIRVGSIDSTLPSIVDDCDGFDPDKCPGSILDGGDGKDWIEGGKGNDIINGGAGPDFLRGGPGDDMIFGDAGKDELVGGSNTAVGDTCTGGGQPKDKFRGCETENP